MAFKSYSEPQQYPNFDSNSLNSYNFKSFNNKFPTYQKYENLNYNSRFPNLVSIARASISNLDPSNIPCNYQDRNLYNVNFFHENEHNWHSNFNPNTWLDGRAKPQFFLNTRPKSQMIYGQLTSHTDTHGYIIT